VCVTYWVIVRLIPNSKYWSFIFWILVFVGILIIFGILFAAATGLIFGTARSTTEIHGNSITPITTIEPSACVNKCNEVCLDDEIVKCSFDRLKNEGYIDCIDCIKNSDNPKCNDVDRYNAEVDARNDCWNQTHPSSPLRNYLMQKIKLKD
jgi:hypothetical protein